MMPRYRDRAEAGCALAEALATYIDAPNLLVLGIAQGGVPVAYDVCQALRAPLDVLVVRRICAPHQPDLVLGAVASGGARVLDPTFTDQVPRELLEETIAHEEAAIVRRERALRGHSAPPVNVSDRRVLLVDDGLATGSTMRAAVQATRAGGAREVIVAAPAGSAHAVEEVRKDADAVTCPRVMPRVFDVSQLYETLPPVADAEVRGILEYSWRRAPEVRAPPRDGGRTRP